MASRTPFTSLSIIVYAISMETVTMVIWWFFLKALLRLQSRQVHGGYFKDVLFYGDKLEKKTQPSIVKNSSNSIRWRKCILISIHQYIENEVIATICMQSLSTVSEYSNVWMGAQDKWGTVKTRHSNLHSNKN